MKCNASHQLLIPGLYNTPRAAVIGFTGRILSKPFVVMSVQMCDPVRMCVGLDPRNKKSKQLVCYVKPSDYNSILVTLECCVIFLYFQLLLSYGFFFLMAQDEQFPHVVLCYVCVCMWSDERRGTCDYKVLYNIMPTRYVLIIGGHKQYNLQTTALLLW